MHLVPSVLLSVAASALLVCGSPIPDGPSSPSTTATAGEKLVRLPIKWGKQPSATSLRRKRDPSVSALYNNQGANMLIDVGIGTPAQNFTVEIDTGSSDLWVPTTACPTADCPSKRFDTGASSTFKSLRQEFDISYMDGTALNGTYATDTVTIAGLSVKNQQIGVVTSANTPSDLEASAGILGLGYPRLTSSAMNGGKSYNPFMFSLVEQNLISDHVFSVYMNRADQEGWSGELILGGVDSTKYTGDIQYAQVLGLPENDNKSSNSSSNDTPVYYQWMTIADGISVSNPRSDSNTSFAFELGNGDPLVFVWDTDSTVTYLPKTLAIHMADALVGPGKHKLDASSGFFDVDCNVAQGSNAALVLTMPDESNTLTSKKQLNVSIPVSHLIFDDSEEGAKERVCVLGIRASDDHDEERSIVAGTTVLRALYTVFDIGRNRIGFAQAA